MTLVLEPAIHDLTCVYLCVSVCVYIYACLSAFLHGGERYLPGIFL